MRTTSGTRTKSSALGVEVRLASEGRMFAALASKLSVEGAFVATFHTVREGASVSVELSLPSGPLLLHGVVGRPPMVGNAGFGVTFDALSAEDRARIVGATGAAAQAIA